MKNPWIQALKRRTPLGWLQLSHEKSRLVVAIAGIAFADILIFIQLGFQGSLYDSNTSLIRAIDTDIVLVSPSAKNTQNLATLPRRRLYQSQDIEGVESTQAVYSGIVAWRNPQTKVEANIQIVGLDPDRVAFNLPEVNAQLDALKIPQTVLFDRGSRGDYSEVIDQVEQGNRISTEVDGKTVEIIGLFKLGASFGTDGFLITSQQNFSLLFPRRSPSSVSLGLIDVAPGYDATAVAIALRDYLPNDVEVLTIEEFIAKEQEYWSTESPIGFVFGLGATMAFVVGVVIVYQVLSTDVNAHMQEYATFKAMGYRHRYLLSIIIEESIILAVLGFIPGTILSVGLYRLAAMATSLPLLLTVSRSVFVFMLTVIMCLMSGAIATRKLQEADPADMF
ncbi:MAG: ABC transporter permease DevC [Elainellaceae cyanobacterium]